VFLELVARADAVLENFRPGVLERLGCAYAALAGANPRVVLCSVPAYGQGGPYRDWPAFDLALQAMRDAMSVTGVPAAPILSRDRVLVDPQVRHRDMVVDLCHLVHGPISTPGTPLKVDGARRLAPSPPPRLGEHTDEVLAGIGGYPSAPIAELRATGVAK